MVSAPYGRSVQCYELLAAGERLPDRPFTDPERTLADASVMDGMLQRLRVEARSWPDGPGWVESLRSSWAGSCQSLVVAVSPALRGARAVTAVGSCSDQ